MDYKTQWIPPGTTGTQATLILMRKLVEEAWTDPRVLDGAASIVPRDYDREHPAPYALAIERWIRSHDCDDVTTLAAALLTILGIPTQIVAIREPGHRAFQHVYVEYWTGEETAALDATVAEIPDGEFDRLTESVLAYG